MTICNGKTLTGKGCRSKATHNGYCRWHKPTAVVEDCGVCYEPFKPLESALPCGHWVHRMCVQKGADCLQESRAKEGYPPIKECTCPVCRAPVPDMKPRDPPPVPPLMSDGILLGNEEMNTILNSWQQSDGVAPLSWYVWVALCEKYPGHDHGELVIVANLFEGMLRMGTLISQPDQRFERVLNQSWR